MCFDFSCTNELSFLSEELGECWDWLRAGERDSRWEQTSFLVGAGGLLNSSTGPSS